MLDHRPEIMPILEGCTPEAQAVLQRVIDIENEYLHQKQPQKMDVKIAEAVRTLVAS